MNGLREGGCLKWFLIGCGGLLLLICGCGFFSMLAFRQAMPEPLPPVEIKGSCPADEVEAFFEGFEGRMERALEPVQSIDQADNDDDLAEALLAIDVSLLEESRDRLIAEPVPECAKPVVEAEAAMLDDAIEILVDVQDCLGAGGGFSPLCIPRAVLALTTRLPGHGERLTQAYEAVGAEAGIEPPEELRFDPDGEGPRFELDLGSEGFEYNP